MSPAVHRAFRSKLVEKNLSMQEVIENFALKVITNNFEKFLETLSKEKMFGPSAKTHTTLDINDMYDFFENEDLKKSLKEEKND